MSHHYSATLAQQPKQSTQTICTATILKYHPEDLGRYLLFKSYYNSFVSFSGSDYLSNFESQKPSFFQHMVEKISAYLPDISEQHIALEILDHTSASGIVPLQWIEQKPDTYIEILKLLQVIGPIGAFARTLEESLELQLRQVNEDSPELLGLLQLSHYIRDEDFDSIVDALKISHKELKVLMKTLYNLNPNPLSEFDSAKEYTNYVKPILNIKVQDLHMDYEVIDSNLTNPVSISSKEPGDNEYSKALYRQATNISEALDLRAKLYPMAAIYALEHQSDYVSGIQAYRKKLILEDIASHLGCSISLAWKIVKNSYISLNGETKPLYYLFNKGVGNSSVDYVNFLLLRIFNNIDNINLSDKKVAEYLYFHYNVIVSRRFITNYRLLNNISNSRQR